MSKPVISLVRDLVGTTTEKTLPWSSDLRCWEEAAANGVTLSLNHAAKGGMSFTSRLYVDHLAAVRIARASYNDAVMHLGRRGE